MLGRLATAMRVALVSKTFVADTAQRQLEWLARLPDVELTLITPPEWRSDDGRLLPFTPRFTAGYDVVQLPIRFNGKYHFYTYRGLRRTLAALRPDIVHIDEEPYNPASLQAQRAADALGAKTLFIAWQSLYRAYPPPFSWIEQANFRRTAHIIAGNADVADVLRRKGYHGPLSVFSVHGVDPELYSPQPRGANAETFIIGYIGRLLPFKGVGLLIDALAGQPPDTAPLPPYCRLRLVGSGEEEMALRARAVERGVADRVEFLPAVPTTEVPRVLAGMDVMALPSLTQANWKEQFGRTLIEAMACEVAVVGSDCGEIPNVIGDAGLVVPEGDVAALASALRRLAEDSALRRMLAGRGRERVLERFTQAQIAQRTGAIYRAVLGASDGQVTDALPPAVANS
jgi:glycosyltransferase involved in cell wall biosynthesis